MLYNEGCDSGDLSTASDDYYGGVNVSTVMCYRMNEGGDSGDLSTSSDGNMMVLMSVLWYVIE